MKFQHVGSMKEIKTTIKKIMIPTTAGTGAEVTPGAVLVNEKTNFKRGLRIYVNDLISRLSNNPKRLTRKPEHANL